MIVVSNERENEFEQERENESSENPKENRTRRREDHAMNCITQQENTSETTFATPSHIVDFIKILILYQLGVDSNVKFLNKLTRLRAEKIKSFEKM